MTPHMAPLRYDSSIPTNHVYLYNHHSSITENAHTVIKKTASAKAFFKEYPFIDRVFWRDLGVHMHSCMTNFTVHNSHRGMPFKVSTTRDAPISPNVIRGSTKRLYEMATTAQDVTFHLPMPCLKGSTMTFSEVVEIYSQLPDNVHVYMISKG